MKSFELNCTHRAQSNYGSSQYDMIFRKVMTVREFIEEVLSIKQEWGEIRVDIGEEPYWINPKCTYRHGELSSKLPEEYLDRIIVSGTADGSWTNVDYFLKMKELPEENLFYDTSEAIRFISERTGIDPEIVEKVLDANVEYMRSKGIIEDSGR